MPVLMGVYMEEKKLYSIGEVSKICNISTKALRFYDKIGIISPDMICKENSYRYYNKETLMTVPVVKYYKQMGFKLEEMQGLVEGNTYYYLEQNFRNKIDQLCLQEQQIHNSYVAVKDWYELIQEAKMVLQNNVHEVSVRFLPESTFCSLTQSFGYNYMESIINIEWTNHLEKAENEITGPVILKFDSFEDKMKGRCDTATIMQKAIHPCKECLNRQTYGGIMVASVYHIGKHETIDEEYERIVNWAAKRGYQCGKESFERYVVDYWTTRNPEEFVTEVIVPVYRQ
ncbi:MerR-like DNA binding protein [Lacrimispora xylanisolvens]|jgi:DNA-binding transcriptional MerR regulator|uniref:MerR-like DNA binding protein n=3 Tax=Lacrimispora TaxID=2719231 RepID=A0A2S6HYL8_9FIRM|nr:MerR-like DNA binding protein [Hungatella xylanolytica]